MDYTKTVSRVRLLVRGANSRRRKALVIADTLGSSHPSGKAGTSQIPIPAPIQHPAHSPIPLTDLLAVMASVHLLSDSFRQHNPAYSGRDTAPLRPIYLKIQP